MRSPAEPSLRTALACLALVCAASCRSVAAPVVAPSWAPEAAADALTHDDCVRLAAGWAPNRAAWSARLDLARAALDQAGRWANPRLDATWEDFRVAGPTATPLAATYSLLGALGDLASRGARRDLAQLELDAERAALEAELARLAYQVHDAYDELVAARASVALEEDALTLTRTQRDAVARFIAVGAAPAIDLARADAEVAQAGADVAAARADARALELELCFALGFERPVALTLAEGWTPLDAPSDVAAADDPNDADLEALLMRAAELRPELREANARYAAQRARAKLSADNVRFFPNIGAGLRFEGGETRGVAALDVELPLFDGGGPALHAGDAMLLQAAAGLRQAAHDLGAEVTLARERLTAARRFLDQHAQRAEALRADLSQRTERLFEAGEVSFDDLMRARRDELDARRVRLAAARRAAHARLELTRALGALTLPRP
ncbi:MAG: TolC family protein [Planctomycetota bacterium]